MASIAPTRWRPFTRSFLCAFCLLFFQVPAGSPAGDATPLPQFFEGFSAKTVDGRTVRLSEYRGKVVILNFWATWCFPCLYEMPLLQRIHTRFEDRGLTVVAVAVFDELESVRSYQTKYGYTFPILFHDSNAGKNTLGLLGVPQTYILGRDGALVSFEDPKSNKVSYVINDPTVWEGVEIVEFLQRLIEN